MPTDVLPVKKGGCRSFLPEYHKWWPVLSPSNMGPYNVWIIIFYISQWRQWLCIMCKNVWMIHTDHASYFYHCLYWHKNSASFSRDFRNVPLIKVQKSWRAGQGIGGSVLGMKSVYVLHKINIWHIQTLAQFKRNLGHRDIQQLSKNNNFS